MGGLVTLLFGHLIDSLKRKAIAIGLFAGAGVGLLFAFIFALVSLRHWIVVEFGSQYPDLWIALGFIVLAVILIGIGSYIASQRPKSNPGAAMALLAAPPAFKLATRMVSPRLVAVGVVLAAGLLVGRRITSR